MSGAVTAYHCHPATATRLNRSKRRVESPPPISCLQWIVLHPDLAWKLPRRSVMSLFGNHLSYEDPGVKVSAPSWSSDGEVGAR